VDQQILALIGALLKAYSASNPTIASFTQTGVDAESATVTTSTFAVTDDPPGACLKLAARLDKLRV
jgi:hypothetical protein